MMMVMNGVPEHLRSDNGPEFVAKHLRKWLAKARAKTLYIQPGSPWENGYCESFNSKLRDEFLNGEIFYSIKELRVLAERWRVHYNTVRPHSSLGYRPRAPEASLTNNCGAWRSGNTRASRFSTPRRHYLNSEIAALHQLIPNGTEDRALQVRATRVPSVDPELPDAPRPNSLQTTLLD